MEEIEMDGEKRMVLTPREGDDCLNFLEKRIDLNRRQIKARVATMGVMLPLALFFTVTAVMGGTFVIGPLGVLIFWMVVFTAKAIGLQKQINKDIQLRDNLLVKMGNFEIGRAFRGEEEEWTGTN